MEKGIIFDIKRFAIHDGPGIRSTIFMKGCPLSCLWCHNPEGIFDKITHYSSYRRLGDKTFERKEAVGKEYSSEELMAQIRKDRPFYDESEGGVTFSGGEPMRQWQFLLELLECCKKEGIHTAVDTSGFAMGNIFEKVAKAADLILFDLKHADAQKHKEYTGVELSVIKDNLYRTAQSGTKIWLRIPVIPGYSDNIGLVDEYLDIISPIKESIKQINLLPFHATADHKYERMNINNRMANIASLNYRDLEAMASAMSQSGLKVVIGG